MALRTIKDPKPVAITLSEFENLREQGYEPLGGGDASRANCDYFLVMVRKGKEAADVMDVCIVCPTFLRGPLGCTVRGGFSY